MGQSLRHRVEEAVRPRIPVAALPAVVRLRARRARARRSSWETGLRNMRFLMGAHAPETDFDDLTRRYLDLMMWRGELRWHPELIARQRVEGYEHLEEAHAGGRGVILSFLHHGFYDGLFPSLSRLGIPVAAIATPHMFKDEMAPWLRKQLEVVSLGAPALNADLGTRGIIESLERGQALGIATDVPSTTPMEFLGRQVRGASGAARIAHSTGAPVVMVTSHPDQDASGRPAAFLRIAPRLDPSAFDSPTTLLTAMVQHLEQAVAAWPEASDQPLKRWKVDEQHADG